MPNKPVSISLDRDGKIVEPAELLDLLRDADDVDITIDATDTSIITSRHIQVLISAERRNQKTNHEFAVKNRNEQFENCLALLGWKPNT